MAEPKGMIAPPRQPIGWTTHKYQHCMKTVMPARSMGTNMNMHRNIPKELLPNARYNKLPERWRWKAHVLPPVSEKYHNTHTDSQDWKAYNTRGTEPAQARTRSAHLDLRPPSAYSESIILKPVKPASWTVNQKLDTNRLRALMRDNTFYPGNFSTLYKCSKQKVDEMVNRLSYDPHERREQLILSDNSTEADTAMYSKSDIDAIVKRLATMKSVPPEEPEPEKKELGKELSAKEQEIVDRLSKYEHPADKTVEEPEEEKKTVTKAEYEEILKRLTQKKERKLKLPAISQAEAKKVSAAEMDTILTRLTTYDSQKWPPESKPEIFKQHARDD